MYLAAHFAETRPEALQRIMREHPLGMLVTHGSAGLDADHIPFGFDADTGTYGGTRQWPRPFAKRGKHHDIRFASSAATMSLRSKPGHRVIL